MNLSLVSGPDDVTILDWLSVAEMKKHCRVVGTSQDDVMGDCILSAYAYLAGRRGRLQRTVIGPVVWSLTIDAFPEDGVIHLPYPPVRSVTSVTYLDDSGAAVVVSASDYVVSKDEVRPVIRPLDAWPTAGSRPDAVTIVFSAGWDAEQVTRRIRRTTKLLAAHYFENREATMIDSRSSEFSHEIPLGIESLIELDRVPNRYV